MSGGWIGKEGWEHRIVLGGQKSSAEDEDVTPALWAHRGFVLTLASGIDKDHLPKEKFENVVGSIPIEVTFEQFGNLFVVVSSKVLHSITTSMPVVSSLPSLSKGGNPSSFAKKDEQMLTSTRKRPHRIKSARSMQKANSEKKDRKKCASGGN
ncbi:hypothetical protein Syun_013823 [Stephania yunnanensis]|uniref:Uncharacterized protein n=1 Tax=Stephania yunnanensis TaxID=152371 RepID=A0AAP0JJV9_9MAGN